MGEGLARDVRYAFRNVARTPFFSAIVVLTLAVGIGFNTAIFSIADRLLLRPLPFPDGDRVVVLYETGSNSSKKDSLKMDVSPANWLDWQDQSRSFEGLAAWTDRIRATLTGYGDPERLNMDIVSHEFFSVLGVQPALGRVFNAEDDQPGTPSRVVLSYSFWSRRFGADPGVIGQIIQLNEAPAEVIGVMPAGFRFMSQDTDVWSRFALDRAFGWREAGGRFIPYVVGRLRPTVTLEAAQAELRGIADRLAELYSFNRNTSIAIVPLRDVLTHDVRASLIVLLAAVGVLVLIACSNVANLLLARTAGRRRELAIRSALGAGRVAIMRKLILESVLLALAGGAAGLVIAKASVRVLLTLAPPALLRVANVPLDLRVMLYAFGLALLTGVVVGLVPSIVATRAGHADSLSDRSHARSASPRLQQALIVVQIALTVILLSGAGLLTRTLAAMNADPTGVSSSRILTMNVQLPPARYRPAQQAAFYQQALESLKAVPGVQATAAARDIPISLARISGTGFLIQGQPEPASEHGAYTLVRVVTPGYFETLGIPVRGRGFADTDPAAPAPPVFVVNEAFVRQFLRDADPLASSLSVHMQAQNPFGSIVGVAGDVKDGSLRGVPQPTVFYSNRQLVAPEMMILIKSDRGGATLAREAVAAIRALDANVPVSQVRMLDEAFTETVARDRLNALVSSAFAVSALLLASLGLYGLLGYTVTERTAEIGVRMALGARTTQVLRMFAAIGLRLVAIGSAAGVVGALALSRFLDGFVYGVTPRDPATFVGVILLLFGVSTVAVLLPAHRATRVPPVVALRSD